MLSEQLVYNYQKFQDRDLYFQQHDQSLLAIVLVGDACNISTVGYHTNAGTIHSIMTRRTYIKMVIVMAVSSIYIE